MPGNWIKNKNDKGYTYVRTFISCPEKYGEVNDGTWQKEQERKKINEQDKEQKTK